MLTLGVGLEASHGARSTVLQAFQQHGHLPEPQLGRASVAGRVSGRTARRHTVDAQVALATRICGAELAPVVDPSRQRVGSGVSPRTRSLRAQQGPAGSRLQAQAAVRVRVLNHEKEPT